MKKAKIRITKAADDQTVRLIVNGESLTIPRDDDFHTIDAKFLPALDDSAVEYEVAGAKASAGGAAGLGGFAAPPNPLDHDNNGKRGGSKKGAESTRAKGAAKKRAAAKQSAKKAPAKGKAK